MQKFTTHSCIMHCMLVEFEIFFLDKNTVSSAEEHDEWWIYQYWKTDFKANGIAVWCVTMLSATFYGIFINVGASRKFEYSFFIRSIHVFANLCKLLVLFTYIKNQLIN